MTCGAGVDEHGLYDVYVHIGYLGGETSSDRAHEGTFGRMQAFFLARRWWVVAAMYSKDDAGWFCFGRFGLCPTICIADSVIVGE